jgi:hypothetical protein
MSQAYKCDLCGDFISLEADAKRQRNLAQEDTTISNTSTVLTLRLDLGKPHVCDKCFAIGIRKTKAWVIANIT